MSNDRPCLAEIQEAIAAAVPDRECLVFRDRRLTWGQLNDRTRRLANVLAGAGLGAHADSRAGFAGHESHQDHIALYLHNGNEYIEAMLGAFKARVAPVNVNYRYVAEELRYLLDNSQVRAVIYHSAFAPTLAQVLPQLGRVELLLQVADESAHSLLPGARWYEESLAVGSAELPDCASRWTDEDLYILYTGGTTGLPKGVLWRQQDILCSAMGGRSRRGQHTLDAMVAHAVKGRMRFLPSAPFMHGAGHWVAFVALNGGHTVIIPSVVDRLDPHDMLSTIEREGVSFLQLVGDAVARPLLDEAGAGSYDLSSLTTVSSGGAALSVTAKERLLNVLPQATIIDRLGSSEGGGQVQQVITQGSPVSTGLFKTTDDLTSILSEDLTCELTSNENASGWLATKGNVPLGYLGDPAKSATTFPTINGVRWSVPGDRARWTGPGELELLGRDSVTINSGGEKIFAEEVEAALSGHPAVYDVVVCGRPSERWGSEVVAVVQVTDGAAADEASLTEEAAKHIARYKLPKAYVFVDRVVRSPAGKADYGWAREQALRS